MPEVPEALEPVPPESFPDGLIGAEVRAALAALPPRMRAAVVLRHWLDGEGHGPPSRPAWPVPRRKEPPVNDMKELLELALGEHTPGPDRPADSGADLARGRRRRLRRRRAATLAGVTAVVLCSVAVPLGALHGAGANTAGHSSAASARAALPGQTAVASHARSPDRIELVVWKGTQPPGYQVSEVPRGWVVQGSNPYALTIAPANDPDKAANNFAGKLVVVLRSVTITGPPTQGTPQPVNGRQGMFGVEGDTQSLIFLAAGGHWVVVQAPTSLGWDSAELAKFASGVRVLVTARQMAG